VLHSCPKRLKAASCKKHFFSPPCFLQLF
jgi:hypothetical protein